jgi:hypothetical protein
MKKQHLRQSSDDDEEAPSSRQHDDDMTTENESGSNYDSALRQKKHQKEAEQHCTSSSQDDIMEKKVDLEDGSEMFAAAHNDAPQDSRNDDSRRPGNDIQINPTVDGYGIPIGVPGAYRVTPRGSTNDATALHHRDDGFPGQVFFVPGEPLLRPQRDVVEELDRLGVPTIICDALPTEVNDDNNIDDDNHHDEENIPSAEVSHAQVAEPLNTSSVCCLHKEVNRGTAKWIISSLSLVVLVSIASVVAIFINQRKDDTIFDAEDNMKSSILDEEANIKYIQELVSTLSSHEVLQDPSSPQSKAVAWMVGQPDLNFIHIQGFDVESRVKERYAMAVFYFSTNGENWTRNEQYLARSPICAWDASIIKCHPMIMEEDGEVMDTSRFSMRWGGRVVELNLGKFTLHSLCIAWIVFVCQE